MNQVSSVVAWGAILGAGLGIGMSLIWWWWNLGKTTLKGRVDFYLKSPAATVNQNSFKRLVVLFSGPALELIEALSKFSGVSKQPLPLRLRMAHLELDVAKFRQMQVACLFAFLVGGAGISALGMVFGDFNVFSATLISLAALVLGALLPHWWLDSKVKNRQSQLTTQLPDAVELLALAVGSGQSLPVALERVAQACGGPVAQEFRYVLNRCHTGDSLASALSALHSQTTSVPLQRLIDALVGAIERGNALATLLRDQALDTRRQARQLLLEKGGRSEVWMLIPVVFGILPLSVIFALFPGLISLQMSF